MEGAPEHDRLAGGKRRHLIEESASLQRNDASEMPERGRRILALLDTKPPEGYANWTDSLASAHQYQPKGALS
jgi:hypothetical protein